MFTQNRERLFDVASGGLIVLTAYDLMQYSGDMEAVFLQESSFWWLTGIEEPGWKVIIDGARRRTTLVRPDRSKVDVIFNGAESDEALLQLSGADDMIVMGEFESTLRQLHRKHSAVQTISEQRSYDFILNPAGKQLTSTLKRVFDNVQDCTLLLQKLRAIKQPSELVSMQRAIDLTIDGFTYVRENFSTFKNECQIDAEFTYRFRRAGAVHAYQPVVASGASSCTLHHMTNNQRFGARDMVVIDIGARVDGYSADITRTYCRNPTKRQHAVHAAVEQAHQQIIALISPGVPVAEYIKESDAIMKNALMGLGLLQDVSDVETYRRYFPHSISHGLGVDTHDSLGAPRVFEVGMVLTVEPGIYIPDEAIGVRIEDDILVTDKGRRNLSGKLSTALN